MAATETPAPDLALLLAQAGHALSTEMAAGLQDLGVSPRSHCVLQHAMAGQLTQKELAEQCDLDKTTMVSTIDDLEARGLAERRPSPTDRRARIIEVTPAGRKMVASGQRVVAGIYDEVLGTLPEGEREVLLAALTRLVEGRLSVPAACQRAPRRRAERAAVPG